MNSSLRKNALIAGFSLLFMAAAAGFSFGYVHSSLIVNESPFATFQNLKLSPGLFSAGIGGWGIVLLLDIIVSWALYLFFREVHNNISLATAVIRLIYSGILAAAICFLISILPLLDQNATQAMQTVTDKLYGFEQTWSAGLILFGFHLAGLGYLSLRSDFVPKVLGILLIFAGICYTLIHIAKMVLPEYESQVATVEMILSMPMALGELAFAFWLIFRGGKSVPERKNR